MEQNNNFQLFADPNNSMSGNNFSPERVNEIFFSSESYSQDKPMQLLNRQNAFDGISPAAKFFKPGTTLFPATKVEALSYEGRVKKTGVDEVAIGPYFNIYLKETAARLSDIELAIDCYDATMFQFAIHSLKGLFINMQMAGASRLTGQMEELAAENKLQDVKELLIKIKKIIAQVVQSMR